MINGDLNYFMEKLYWGEEVVVDYKGHMYFIQGYSKPDAEPDRHLHMEVFPEEADDEFFAGVDYIWQMDGATPEECVSAFRKAKIWEGLDFDEAEPEIEWVY